MPPREVFAVSVMLQEEHKYRTRVTLADGSHQESVQYSPHESAEWISRMIESKLLWMVPGRVEEYGEVDATVNR